LKEIEDKIEHGLMN
jgi:hypothetical protein